MSLFMPPVLLPSTLLPSNICRFAVNNAKFASLEIFTLSNPRKVEETDLSVSLSFSFFRNSKKGIESYYKSLVERVTFSPVHFPRPSRGIIVIFPRHSCLSQKSCEITAHSFFVELLYCTLGMEYWLEGGAISPMTTLENYRREVDG